MEEPQKIKDKTTVWSRNPTSGCILEGKENTILRVIFNPMFIAVLIIAKKWKLPKYLSMDRWMHKENVVCIHTHTHKHTHAHIMEYFSSIKEGNPDISYNMNKTWECYAKWHKPNREK